ncbi:MAG TPA: amidohydrolase family protein [Ktedonobacterales bacterium]|jgi:predicted TIM-barrel fold metal-dependent hydrolase|nr:amidohydrolase family protein [Ktedonobacterales bacterium]
MIVDFHTHIFPPDVIARREVFAERDPWFAELYSDPRARMADAEQLIGSMALAGVDHSVTFSFGWSDPGLIEECNSYVIDAVRRYPRSLTGLAVIQPLARARAVAEIERCARAGLAGVGELMPHGQGYTLSDLTVMAPIAETCLAHNLFLLTHTSEPVGHLYRGKGNVSSFDLYAFLLAFPELRVVAAHWGGGFPFYQLMPEVHAAAVNLWYDSAASLYLYRPEVFSTVGAMCGANKVLWASDYPLISQQRMLAYLSAAGLDEAALALAIGGNAAAFLGLDASASAL